MPPRLTVSEWTDANRILNDEFSAEPGPYRTDRVPYLREIMDAAADPRVSQIHILKSSQVGGTECVNNIVLYYIATDPAPMLFVLPTEDDAIEEVGGRLKYMIQDCPEASKRVPSKQKKWATAKMIRLRGMRLYMAWAQSARTMIRRAIAIVVLDELGNIEKQVGNLGNYVDVAGERVRTFGDRGLVMSSSTPQYEDDAACLAFDSSDKRRYYVPCPACGTYQVMKMAGIRAEPGTDPDRMAAEKLAWYECESCSEHIHDSRRWWMVRRGVWLPEGQTPSERLPLTDEATVAAAISESGRVQWRPSIAGDPPITSRRGYHVWAAMSPWLSWSAILGKYKAVVHNPDKLRVFINSWLGEPWRVVKQTPSDTPIREKIVQGVPRFQVPDGARMLVAGADVQHDRAVYVTCAFGPMSESWMIDHGTVFATGGETILDVLQRLYDMLAASGLYAYASGGKVIPRRLLIDAGEGQMSRLVYGFCRDGQHAGCLACKGEPGERRDALVRAGTMEARRGKAKRVRSESHTLYLCNTFRSKEILYAASTKHGDGPGVLHFHHDTDDEFVSQFTAEHLVEHRGKLVWKLRPQRRDNHYLDAMVYALAAADLVGALTIPPDHGPVSAVTPAAHQTPGPGRPRRGQSYRLPRRTSTNRY